MQMNQPANNYRSNLPPYAGIGSGIFFTSLHKAMQLRQYQQDISEKATEILKQYNIVYLSMEVRTGKTITALQTAANYGAKHVLFITKKKAISSIQNDVDAMQPFYTVSIINYEKLPSFELECFDLVILDEAHCLGQFPVPAERTKELKNICAGLPIIYLSGTPTPESYSQIYHQFYVSSFSPFAEYSNFYKWAKDYVEMKVKYIYNRQINDYSRANLPKIKGQTDHLFLSFTQHEAGFTEYVKEAVLKVEMRRDTYALAQKIKNTRVHIGKNGEEIIADTEVKLMQKLHQIYSGTVLTEQGEAICFDDYKADFIKTYFKGRKIAIFYKFKAELTLLQKAFGDAITMLPDEFNNSTDKVFCSQIQSGREGINLSTADCLVMYNIDFSSVSYQQAKARMQSKDRTKECLLYWIFSEGGIEEKIYERVVNKQDYTISYFRKDFGIKTNKQVA